MIQWSLFVIDPHGSDRGVFGDLVILHGQHDAKRLETLFDYLYRLIDNSKTSVKETVLVTTGNLGK